MSNPGHAQIVLQQLAAMGVTLSIDDFGTGFSSLAYLKRLPVQELKIDKSFVQDALENRGDRAIVETVIALGRSFGLQVIAEGVENERMLDFVLEQGCDVGQGYFFSQPLPANEFDYLLDGRIPVPRSL